ncbi:unnamed protein product [Mycoplasmopsis agalactiae]|uniref:Uncharacterized protein n=1 Tax=Mycoplasmopsis agalactiae TaxID=2110 RepID=D3VPU4_MYCAA|nr:unnamed protein product [Mycoplasmopsis agalactiae]
MIIATGSLSDNRVPTPGFVFLLIATAARIMPNKANTYPITGSIKFFLSANLLLNRNTATESRITAINAPTNPTAPNAVHVLPATLLMSLLKPDEPNKFDIYVINLLHK